MYCIPFAGNITKEPAFYVGRFSIDKVNQVKDTYLSFSGWGKGIAFVNEFNLGRFWPVKFFLISYMQLSLIVYCYGVVIGPFAVFWTSMQPLCPCSNPSSWGKSCGMWYLFMYVSGSLATVYTISILSSLRQVIFELESPNSELVIHSVNQPDFTCGSSKSNVLQL